MHRFGYEEIRGDIPGDIVSLIRSITEIRSMDGIRQESYGPEFKVVEKMAMLASTKYSNEIEGISTSDERIRELIVRGGTPITHEEAEIAGYRDALSSIHSDHEHMDLDEETILALHAMMMRYSGAPSGYKDRDNVIVSVDGNGRREVIFRPVPASETKDAMEQLVLAYMDARDSNYERLLLIPCLILDFLSIHPFSDGNGRVSRLLTEVLLYNNGFDVCRYISLDEHIYATRKEYYAALNGSSSGWYENDFSYFPFIRYFLRMLLECYIDLDTRFSLVRGRKMQKGERIEAVIMGSLAPISKAQVCFILPDVSRKTVDAAVARMLKDGRIEKVGTFKDARYVAKRP